MQHILTDRGIEYYTGAEYDDYQLHMVINDIDHTKTKVMSPIKNVNCEWFHKASFLK